jgi:hypothetical protein
MSGASPDAQSAGLSDVLQADAPCSTSIKRP